MSRLPISFLVLAVAFAARSEVWTTNGAFLQLLALDEDPRLRFHITDRAGTTVPTPVLPEFPWELPACHALVTPLPALGETRRFVLGNLVCDYILEDGSQLSATVALDGVTLTAPLLSRGLVIEDPGTAEGLFGILDRHEQALRGSRLSSSAFIGSCRGSITLYSLKTGAPGSRTDFLTCEQEEKQPVLDKGMPELISIRMPVRCTLDFPYSYSSFEVLK